MRRMMGRATMMQRHVGPPGMKHMMVMDNPPPRSGGSTTDDSARRTPSWRCGDPERQISDGVEKERNVTPPTRLFRMQACSPRWPRRTSVTARRRLTHGRTGRRTPRPARSLLAEAAAVRGHARTTVRHGIDDSPQTGLAVVEVRAGDAAERTQRMAAAAACFKEHLLPGCLLRRETWLLLLAAAAGQGEQGSGDREQPTSYSDVHQSRPRAVSRRGSARRTASSRRLRRRRARPGRRGGPVARRACSSARPAREADQRRRGARARRGR